jgi:hypothetical protein
VSIEQVVRPFQSGDVFTARSNIPTLSPSGSQISTDDCTLEWAAVNPGDYSEIPSDLQLLGFHVDWKEDKSKRVMEEVKIEQDDNPDNYVMVQRMKETQLVNMTTGQAFNMKFDEWDKGRK